MIFALLKRLFFNIPRAIRLVEHTTVNFSKSRAWVQTYLERPTLLQLSLQLLETSDKIDYADTFYKPYSPLNLGILIFPKSDV